MKLCNHCLEIRPYFPDDVCDDCKKTIWYKMQELQEILGEKK